MFIIKPYRTILILAIVILALLIGHGVGMTLKFGLGEDFALGFVPLMDFDREGNLPTFYSSTVLMLCGILLGLIAVVLFQMNERGWLYWAGLSLLFLFVSVDESISIHEQLIRPLREAFDLSGIFYFAWVIPYMLILLILAAIYFRFLVRLPQPTRKLFVLAAIIFLSGALGCELIGGYYFELVQEKLTLIYALITTTEELLEMVGVLVFLYAIMAFIKHELNGIQISIASSEDAVTGLLDRPMAVANSSRQRMSASSD